MRPKYMTESVITSLQSGLGVVFFWSDFFFPNLINTCDGHIWLTLANTRSPPHGKISEKCFKKTKTKKPLCTFINPSTTTQVDFFWESLSDRAHAEPDVLSVLCVIAEKLLIPQRKNRNWRNGKNTHSVFKTHFLKKKRKRNINLFKITV